MMTLCCIQHTLLLLITPQSCCSSKPAPHTRMTPITTSATVAVNAKPVPHTRRNTPFFVVTLPGPVSDVPLSTRDCAPYSYRCIRVGSTCTACLELALARPTASEAKPCEGCEGLQVRTLDALLEALCGREIGLLQLAGLLAMAGLKPELGGASCGSGTSISKPLPADMCAPGQGRAAQPKNTGSTAES